MAQASTNPPHPAPPAAAPLPAKRSTPWPAIVIAAVTVIPAMIGIVYQLNRNPADDGTTDAAGLIAWRYTGVKQAVTAPPAVSPDGTVVYIAPAEGDGIVAVDAETDRLRWAAPLGGATAGPVAAGDLVYVANLVGILFAVDPQSGVERWRAVAGGTYQASPLVADGTLYIGNRDGHLYALDAATGAERWRVPTGDWVDTTPALAGGLVYAANRAGTLLALDAATGQERWRQSLGPAGSIPSPAASSDLGIVAAVGADGILRVYDATTGQIRWTLGPDGLTRTQADVTPVSADTGPAADAPATTFAGPPVIAHGLVYAGTGDARLLALDAATGRERWHSVGETLTPGYAPVVAGDVVYLLHADLGILAFSATDGLPRWLFENETRGERLSPLTLAPNPSGDPAEAVLYLGSDRGILRAVMAPRIDNG